MGQALTTAGAVAPAVGASADPAERLKKLKALADAGVITTEDFERKKKDILDTI